jgi:hypothetical protein
MLPLSAGAGAEEREAQMGLDVCFTAAQVGQATTIHHWVYEDGTEGGPAAAGALESTERPTEEELSRAGNQSSVLSAS